ncbi:MAG TPA: hypothetical protein ENN29_04580 [Candidatus Hydrogenedentes bacterium]|nr:hypothetical protein [Candidatus Hydrogenedentota bacterium]
MARRRNRNKGATRKIRKSEGRLLRRLSEKMLDADGLVVKRDSGGGKMSEILLDFVDPFIADCEDIEICRNIIRLAVMVWNTSLLPQEKGKEALEKMVASFDKEAQVEGCMIIYQMLNRKMRFFSHCNRCIFDFDLIDKGSDWHLNVVSSLTTDSP